MKIGIDAREFKKGIMTGIGRFLKNFINGCGKYSKDVEITLLGDPDTFLPFPLPENSRLIKFSSPSTQIWEQIYINSVVRQEKLEVFLSPYYKRPLFISIPSVIVIHDLIPLLFGSSFREKFILKTIMKIYARGVEIVTDSENSFRDICSILKIPPSRINVVYTAVDTDFFRPRSKEEVSSFLEKKSISGKYILYVGNSNAHKNLSRLISSYSILPEKLKKEYALVIAGVERNVYFNTGSTVLLIGNVLDEELPLLYSGASLFVFPSLYEGFGLPPVEAMACGCPVLSSSASCMPEVLGDAAEYFDPFNEKEISSKINWLLSSPDLLKTLSLRGRIRASLYSQEEFCFKILNVLKKATRR